MECTSSNCSHCVLNTICLCIARPLGNALVGKCSITNFLAGGKPVAWVIALRMYIYTCAYL